MRACQLGKLNEFIAGSNEAVGSVFVVFVEKHRLYASWPLQSGLEPIVAKNGFFPPLPLTAVGWL